MAYDLLDFETDVLEASHTLPVLVDFWAPWCGPCRALSPALERLADEQSDRWKLVKINSDEYPALAQQYGVRGIPNVKLFVDGEVVNEFTGALPEPMIRRWLDEALPTETKLHLAQALGLIEAGSPKAARPFLETILATEPDNAEARLLLAQVLAFRDPDRAETLINDTDVHTPALLQTAEAIRTLARLHRLNLDDLDDALVRPTYRSAIEAVKRQDFDEALSLFTQVIVQDRYYDDDGSRKAGVALFTLLGPQHPATRKHRRLFDMALY